MEHDAGRRPRGIELEELTVQAASVRARARRQRQRAEELRAAAFAAREAAIETCDRSERLLGRVPRPQLPVGAAADNDYPRLNAESFPVPRGLTASRVSLRER